MKAPVPELPTDLVPVGHITGAFGLQGWVKIHPYSSDATALLHAKTWWLGKAVKIGSTEVDPSAVQDVEKLEAKLQGDAVVARIMGIATRDAAENLKGHVIQIQRSHFPVLSNNEYYWTDLIGMNVVNLQGEHLGVVEELIDNGAHPILRVVKATEDDQREYLIPFVEKFVPVVDQKGHSIKVDWGLDY